MVVAAAFVVVVAGKGVVVVAVAAEILQMVWSSGCQKSRSGG